MGNWTPEGHIGQMFKAIGKHAPPPPYFPSPLLWAASPRAGSFRVGVSDLRITRYMYPFEYPFAPAKVVDFFIEYYGPTNRAYLSLDAVGQKAKDDDLTALWTKNNVAPDRSTRVFAEYLEVVGTRA